MRIHLSSLLLLLLATSALAAPPRTLSYQGVLTDGGGGTVSDGSYSMTFGLYLAPSGGAALWSESQNVTVTNGNFDVVLGAVTPISALSFEDPYWLGLQVNGDPEMTPRTEITGGAYSQIARTVEDGAVTADKIANDTVVRSLNGIDDAVSIVAGNNIAVTEVNDSIRISATGGGNAPGVASAGALVSGVLDSEFKELMARTINCPAAGYVLVIASTDIYLGHTGNNPTWVQVGTSNNLTSLSSSQDLVAQIPFSAGAGTYTIPLTAHGIYPVSAGINTFYLLGRLGSLEGSANVSNRYMSLVFFEASYGTVVSALETDPSETQGPRPGESEVVESRVPPTDEQIAREMADLRARMESLEAALER